MRLRIFLIVLLWMTVACHSQQQEPKTAQPKKPAKNSEPVDLGDNTAPVEVRALHGAKEVRKRIEEQRKEDRPIVDEANQ